MAHAKLSASGAKRWMSCPPSANLEALIPDKGSAYAAEGTFAHSLAEQFLRYNNRELTKKEFMTEWNRMKTDENYSREMEDHITDYANQVWEIYNTVRNTCPDALILFEQRLDFSAYVPEGFGTGDVVIIADDFLHVIDLKYGKGVGVSAEGNPQLRLYGIGAYLEYSLLFDINRIHMTIIQPRLENLSTEELTVDDLLTWAEEEVRPKAKLAMEGAGEFLSGDHCRFCKAKAACRARAEENLKLTKLEFRDPALLDVQELGDILFQVEKLSAWAKDVQEYTFEEALKGIHFPGWKLVEGRSNRKYSDEAEVKKVLLQAGYEKEKILKPETLVGLTDMTKVLGKRPFEELLGDLLVKPEGKPVLVPESDSRPERNTLSAALNDFK